MQAFIIKDTVEITDGPNLGIQLLFAQREAASTTAAAAAAVFLPRSSSVGLLFNHQCETETDAAHFQEL